MVNHPDLIISATTRVEARVVAEARLGEAGKDKLEALLEAGGVRTDEQKQTGSSVSRSKPCRTRLAKASSTAQSSTHGIPLAA